MHFPVIFHLFGLALPVHQAAEAAAYLVGLTWYAVNRLRWSGRAMGLEKNLWLLVFMFFGSLVGSRLMAWAQNPADAAPLLIHHFTWMLLRGGQEVLGGLVGGWLAVEVGKKVLRIAGSTGDPMVLPLIAGMAIGRLGCFFTGLSDGTCGLPTNLPWGVNFGDGIPRHPAQLYDIVFLLLLGFLLFAMPPARVAGTRFRLFMAFYSGYRFLIDFLKPREMTWFGLSAIQWLCVPVLAYCLYWLIKTRTSRLQAAARVTLEATG